jgi:hypothetical protein
MLSNKFKINEVDNYIYIKNKDKSMLLYISKWMICLFLIFSNDYMIKSTKKILTNKFDMKDLNFVNVILEITISRKFDGLIFLWSHYVEKVIDRFSKGNNNIVKTSMDMSVHVSKNKGTRIN